MTKRLSTSSMILLLLFFGGRANSTNKNQITNEALTTLKEGDLLFQDLNCGELCDAIETVTQGVDGKDFSHCARWWAQAGVS